MGRIYGLGFAICLLVVLAGCSTGVSSVRMIPEDVVVTNRHPYSVMVITSGGQESMLGPDLSNEDFQSAVVGSLKKYNIFKSVVTDGISDLRLEVVLQKVDKPSFGLDMTASIATKWTFSNVGGDKIETSDIITNTYTATVGDALIGQKRILMAIEGAARSNIRDALMKTSNSLSGSIDELKLAGELKLAEKDFEKALTENNIVVIDSFLTKHPDSKRRDKALSSLVNALNRENNIEKYKLYLTKYPEIGIQLPAKLRLSLCGPEGLRVIDIVAMQKNMNEKLIVSKIRISKGRYYDFSVEDMSALKKMGLTDDIVQALIESTEKADTIDVEKKNKQELNNTLRELKNAQKELAESKKAQNQLPAGAGANKILGSCLKLTAALNGCAYVPGGYFAKLACESAAKMTITCD